MLRGFYGKFSVCDFGDNLKKCCTKNTAMAESRGSLLAKSVQKHAGRAKEKVSDIFIKLG